MRMLAFCIAIAAVGCGDENDDRPLSELGVKELGGLCEAYYGVTA